ncbi:hypothetical protein NUW58_g2501 [Xylaria curta]|uniref:Uncharacterized protein n=1 Tax=Xylaria curta TaxID=42375 RepID=A0ACC1PGM1_9PEZI|nr:hypothetical protein NUW58_g2501 [Xylaria curta]
MADNSMVTLMAADHIEIQATLQAVKQCATLGTMLEVLDEQQTLGLPIPVLEVSGEALKKVIEWCEYHREDMVVETEQPGVAAQILTSLPQWDTEFFANIGDKDLLIKICNASNFLEIPLLLQYSIFVIAQALRGKSTEEMRAFLNIENDLTPEEEQKIREDNAWAMPQN